MKKILIVCMGNICRSPMALAVMQKMVGENAQTAHIQVDSAGTHARVAGERADPRGIAALNRRGYQLPKHKSRRIQASDFESFDLILAMDGGNLYDLKRQCQPELHAKLQLFLEFSPHLGLTEVPDPYYGNTQGFERVLDLCEAGIQGLVANLLRQFK